MRTNRFVSAARVSVSALCLSILAALAHADTVVVGPVPGSPALSGLRLLMRHAAITDASAAKPYLLKIEAGVYDLRDRTLAMKPFVDIEGSGEGVTVVRSTVETAGTVAGAANAELRSLTVENTAATGAIALTNNASGFRAAHVTAKAACTSATAGGATGIFQNSTGDVTLRSVTASATGFRATGISSRGGLLTDAVARASSTDLAYAVFNVTSSGELVNVVAEAESGRFAGGIRNEAGGPTLRNVRAFAKGDSIAEGMVNGGGSAARVHGAVIRAVAGSDFAVGVSNEGSSALLQDVDVTAESDSGAFGVSNQFSGAPRLERATVRAAGGGNGIGVLTDGGVSATVESSSVSGDGFSVANGFGSSATVARVGASRLDGPVREGSGALRCVASYDGSFAPVDAACAPIP
jgi:hypothetical protein